MSWCSKALLVVSMLAVGLSVSVYGQARATTWGEIYRLEQQREKIRKQIEDNKKAAEQKRQQAESLTDIVASLQHEIESTQDKITNIEQEIAITNQIIDEINSSINELGKRLDAAYVGLYELSRTPRQEIIFAGSVDEAITQAQYLQSVQTQLKLQITELSSARDKQSEQKGILEALNNELSEAKEKLIRQKNQNTYLLGIARLEQAHYEELLNKLTQQREVLDREIYNKRRELAEREQVSYGTGGYPWANEPNPWAVDPWLFYKRQCTSYAAWKFWAHFGRVFYNTRPGQGSAWNWPTLARDQGYQTSSSPRVNSIVSWPIGPNMPYGHVAWVTGINSDGTINVSEYNWLVERGYSERRFVNPHRYGNPTYIYP